MNWMGGDKKYHVGFPEKALEKNLPPLIDLGYKIAVVEQMETPRQMERRVKAIKNPKEKALQSKSGVKREICNVHSRGTYIDDSCESERWVISFRTSP
jgi:DNA mismatch repair protein MSH6